VLTVSLSRTGVTMFGVSGVLLVLQRTGSAPVAGITAAAAMLPGALSGPLLGAWLDVARSRRLLMVVDQLSSVVCLLALVALAGRAPNWTLPVVAVVYSVTRPFSSASFFSAMAEIVGPELLDHASAIEASSLNLSFVIGPALAGAIAGAAGPAAAIEVQAAIMLVSTVLVAINPAFEARPEVRARNAAEALRAGTRALVGDRVLRNTGIAAMLAGCGWGLMSVGFPLYASRTLGVGANAAGYLWAAVAAGSTIGTFALAGRPSVRRIGASYAILGISALLWPLADTLVLGFLLILLTGFLEGPAYSGTIALRQRLTPPAVRGQVLTTLSSLGMVAASAGAAIGGLVHDVTAPIAGFVVINVLAAAVAVRDTRDRRPDRPSTSPRSSRTATRRARPPT
jgi:MFS family permease